MSTACSPDNNGEPALFCRACGAPAVLKGR